MTVDVPSLLSIVIPAHNEAGILEAAVDRTKATLDSRPDCNSEIIVVDDGSTDDTFKLVSRLMDTVQGLKAHQPQSKIRKGVGVVGRAQGRVRRGGGLTIDADYAAPAPFDSSPAGRVARRRQGCSCREAQP